MTLAVRFLCLGDDEDSVLHQAHWLNTRAKCLQSICSLPPNTSSFKP